MTSTWPSLWPISNATYVSVEQLIDDLPKTSVLYTLPAFDSIFRDLPADLITRDVYHHQVNNVIKINEEDMLEYSSSDSGSEYMEIPHCHFVGMLPFAFDSPWSANISSASIELAQAMALGIQHLNTGDSSLVSSLGDLRESSCSDMIFTMEYADPGNDPGEAIDKVLEIIGRRDGHKKPCSFLASTRSELTMPAALLSGNKGFMELSSSSTSTLLDSVSQYPYFARTVPNDRDNIKPIMDYFGKEIELEYLALIHMNEPYGNSVGEALLRERENIIQEREKSSNAPVIRRFSIDSTGTAMDATLRALENSQFTFIIAAMPTMHFYHKLMETAYDMGLVGNIGGAGYYQWYFTDSFWAPASSMKLSPKLAIAYNGTGMFTPSAGRLENETSYNGFVQELGKLDKSSEDMNYISALIPQNRNHLEQSPENLYQGEKTNNDEFFGIQYDAEDADYFDAAYMYDATIALGMSACRAIGHNKAFNAADQFSNLTEGLRFRGATGEVTFNNKGTRTYESTFYELVNYVTEDVVDENTGKNFVGLKIHTTNIYRNGSWIDVDQSFIYSNGETKKPNALRERRESDSSGLAKKMKITALILSVLSIISAISFGIWTWCHRFTRVIQASQPFFLYLVVFGVIMVGGSIIPFCMDDTQFSFDAMNKACSAVLWLLFPGFSIIFSALFTKTYRINLM
ncbi:unnamed protein product [Pseudo-nitzschia multistriata]|uniref:Receptor ligand binding region domain-containing protein n=1 Tax=Pseudo-nitzschia multistriata TaxID=183589 RepID=A0A448Z463_9STRA|nr:unnamed protein product [Pseudo-nitzschia multistriata]